MNPYQNAPARQFWKHGVGENTPDTVSDIFTPKWPIAGMNIATAGSCFAQEIAKALKARKYAVLDKEPAPGGTRQVVAAKFGYGQYSARHGNIYTSRHLLQLTEEALGLREIPPSVLVWEKEGRYYDAMRPSVEPDGLESPEMVIAQRKDHLRRFRSVLENCDLFVFTLGLTEAWRDRQTGIFFQSTPGTVAGSYDPAKHEFCNMRYLEILSDMHEFMSLARSVRPSMKFLLTVSPVPLTATYEDQHVLVATMRSKSILRAVADELARNLDCVDYFPSFELLSTAFLGPDKFQANRRNVRPEGVEAVMSAFFRAHEAPVVVHKETSRLRLVEEPRADSPVDEEAACEEAMLEGFAPR